MGPVMRGLWKSAQKKLNKYFNSVKDGAGASCKVPAPSNLDHFQFGEIIQNFQNNEIIQNFQNNEKYAEESLDKYQLNFGKKIAIIINHDFKNYGEKLEWREGTELDEKAIFSTFEAIGFNVECLKNPTLAEIQKKIKSVKNMKDISIIAMFILTHGEGNGIVHAKDKSYDYNKIILDELTPDKCQGMAKKPKLIFVQACNGGKIDKGVKVKCFFQPQSPSNTSTDSPNNSNLGDQTSKPQLVPTFADFLIYESSYPGFKSIRNKYKGSWMIRILCQEIERSESDESLSQILLRVSNGVSKKNSEFYGKQVPFSKSTLTKQIFFKCEISPNVTQGIVSGTISETTPGIIQAVIHEQETASEVTNRRMVRRVG